MHFLDPGKLFWLAAVPVLVVLYVLAQLRRRTYAVRFTNLALLDKVAPRRPGFRRHVPPALFLVMMALLVLGFARPQATTRVPREEATVVVAIDTSLSMEADDVSPSRLAGAKEAATSFVDELPKTFNVGLVAFNGSASVVVAPTVDHAALKAGIDALQLGPSTAIGEAVFASLASIDGASLGTGGKRPPARIVLMSDGTNTVGRTPDVAAAAATKAGVPVSTIAYGTADGVVTLQGERIPVPVDVDQLKALAEATGGHAYTAESRSQLSRAYNDIGQSVGYRKELREVSDRFIGAGLLVALLAALASLVWFARLP